MFFFSFPSLGFAIATLSEARAAFQEADTGASAPNRGSFSCSALKGS